MADNISFKIEGLDALIKRIGKLAPEIAKEVALEVNASALAIQSKARRDVKVDNGILRNSIQLKEINTGDKIMYTVGSRLKYAPYVEFGTGGKVSIPAGFEELASGFKGKKAGTFKDMVQALTLWVRRKGIGGGNDKSIAYAIAISILKKGMRPQPFLIPSFETEKPKMINNIKKAIENVKS